MKVEYLSQISYNMDMGKQVLKIYQTSAGKPPFLRWLQSIKDKRTKFRITARLDRLEEGHPGDYKSLGGNVYELRLPFGPGYRIYYGKLENLIILLLCGGDKSSQEKDISDARNYFKEFKER
jgi:putative addiction module killer protein